MNLQKARAAILQDHAFFGSLLCSMQMVEDNTQPTMATDGKQIRYNREFSEGLTHPETVFILAHEVLHPALGHIFRREGRDPKRWNIACDYVVNQLLIEERVGTPIKGILFNPGLVIQGKGTAEGVYALLKKQEDEKKQQQRQEQQEQPEGNPGDQEGQPSQGDEGEGQPEGQEDGNGEPGEDQDDGVPGPGEEGGSLDTMEDAGEDEAEQSEMEADMRVRTIQAANSAKMAGQLSAGLARIVGEAIKPKICWEDVLRRFLTSKAKNDLSYARPNRRFLTEDFILPSLNGEEMGPIVVAVDCSGSIDEETLKLFGAEIKAICEDIHPAETHIVYFDSEVTHVETYGPQDTVEIAFHGGGGTAFSPVFKHIEDAAINPEAVVFLTDLYCDDFGDEPSCPVLWATIGSERAPFGEIVKIK